MSQAPTAFVADVAWRVEPPPRRDGPRLFAAIVIAVLFELGVFALVWTGRNFQPAPPVKEIPVEIVVEKPPPPPPPPPQAQNQEYIKPAIDAPREGKSDHDDDTVGEKPKPAKPPPPPPETPPPTPAPTPEAAKPEPPPPSPPTPSPEASKAAPAPAPELPQTAEAESPPPQKAEPVETPSPAPEKAEPVQTPAPAPTKAEPVEKPAPAKPSVAEILAKNFDSVPDVDFGGAAMRAPVSGGAARANYMSELYGLIVPRLKVPAVAHAYGRRLIGKIGFVVDGRGRLTQRYVEEQSGSLELDEAAMRAVAAAARAFPPPPHKQPLGITFTYSVQ
jgi:TonB family protein